MTKKLSEYQKKLASNNSFFLDVMDVKTDKPIDRGIYQKNLDKDYGGSLTTYIQSLKDKGHQTIQLWPRQKYGNASKLVGSAVTVDFSGTKPNNINIPASNGLNGGMNGLAGTFGLGAVDILDGYAAKRENDLLKSQIVELQRDLKEEQSSKSKWRDKVNELQQSNNVFELKETMVKEPSALDKLINTLAENPSAIPALIGAFKGGGGLPGLAQPQSHEATGYTEMQAAVCEMISHLPSDEHCNLVANIINKILDGDVLFMSELKSLLESNLNALQNG